MSAGPVKPLIFPIGLMRAIPAAVVVPEKTAADRSVLYVGLIRRNKKKRVPARSFIISRYVHLTNDPPVCR